MSIESSPHRCERLFYPRAGEAAYGGDRAERRDEGGVEDDDQENLPGQALPRADDCGDNGEVRERGRELDRHDRRSERKARSHRATFMCDYAAGDAVAAKPKHDCDGECNSTQCELDQVRRPVAWTWDQRQERVPGTDHQHNPAGEVYRDDPKREMQQTP